MNRDRFEDGHARMRTAEYQKERTKMWFSSNPALDIEVQSRRAFIMNTILPQGIGAVSLISDGMAPLPYGG